jgi:PAS domain S-box-containing protein
MSTSPKIYPRIRHSASEYGNRKSATAFFEAAHDGVLILDAISRKITDANPFMSHLLGYRHDELLGKELWEIGLLKDEQASPAIGIEVGRKARS